MYTETTTENTFKPLFKKHRRLDRSALDPCEVFVFGQREKYQNKDYTVRQHTLTAPGKTPEETLAAINATFTAYVSDLPGYDITSNNAHIITALPTLVTIDELPGLKIIPGYLPPIVQQAVVAKTVSKYIPPSEHRCNLDAHFNIPRPLLIFPSQQPEMSAEEYSSAQIQPKPQPEGMQPTPTKPISLSQTAEKLLRWTTLGGQYNWTTKTYPTYEFGTPMCPYMPRDLQMLLGWPVFATEPQSGIINYYSEGHILLGHQDISEVSDRDLVSLSIGCDAAFYIGLYKSEAEHVETSDPLRRIAPFQLLLQSGDILVMGGVSRRAFHGVGRVFMGSCPEYLSHGDAYLARKQETAQFYDELASWVAGKRVNINVRQMVDEVGVSEGR